MELKFLQKFINLSEYVVRPADEFNDMHTVFSFSHYLDGFFKIQNKLFEEIEILYLNVTPEKESDYQKYIEGKIDQVLAGVKVVEAEAIKDWFKLYDLEFQNFDSILNLCQDTKLYSDLRLNEHDGRFDSQEEIYNLHMDFLNYSKHEISEMISSKIKSLIKIQYGTSFNDNLYPFRENSHFEEFKIYLSLHIIDPYPDFSYLFQRLKSENFIEQLRHKDFMKFLKDRKFIDENIHQKLLIERSFRSLAKSYSEQRENNFNNVFKL